MTRSIISTAAAMCVFATMAIFAAAPSQAVEVDPFGNPAALDTGSGFAPAMLAEYDLAPAEIEEVSLSPSIGRTVHLCLSEECAAEINARRAEDHSSGNKVDPGEIVPMVIVKLWSKTTVNGQALLDGSDSLWCTSVLLDTAPDEIPTPGTWRWPERVG